MRDQAWRNLQQQQPLLVLNSPVPLVLDVAALNRVRTEDADNDVSVGKSAVDLIRPVRADRDVVLVHPGLNPLRSQMFAHLPREGLVRPLVRDEDLWLPDRHQMPPRSCNS